MRRLAREVNVNINHGGQRAQMFNLALDGNSGEDSERKHRGLYKKHTYATTASKYGKMHEYLKADSAHERRENAPLPL